MDRPETQSYISVMFSVMDLSEESNESAKKRKAIVISG